MSDDVDFFSKKFIVQTKVGGEERRKALCSVSIDVLLCDGGSGVSRCVVGGL